MATPRSHADEACEGSASASSEATTEATTEATRLARWVEEARSGSAAAQRKLVVSQQATVFAVVGRLLGPAGHGDRVEDVAQESFFRAFDKLHRFDPSRASFRTWLVTIAVRVAIDELRRSRRRPASPLIHEPAEPSPVGEGRISQQRLGQAVEAALARLPEPMRVVVVLRDAEGFSERETAKILGVRPGTVKSRLSRARARLRAELKEFRDA